MNNCTVTLKNIDNTFKYGIQYLDDNMYIENYNGTQYKFSYQVFEKDILNPNDSISTIYFNNIDSTNILRNINNFNINSYNTTDFSIDYIPQDIQLSKINFYIPKFCIDEYDNHYKYVIDISIYISSYKVVLGSFLLSRNDTIALNKPIQLLDKTFYEGVSFNIINPYYIIYSDEWRDFREHICKTPIILGGNEINNDCSLLSVEITPIIKTLIDDSYMMGDYTSGSNILKIYHNDTVEPNNILNNFLSSNIDINIHNNNIQGYPIISNNIVFNSIYEQDFITYLTETYLFDNNVYYLLISSLIVSDIDGNFSEPFSKTFKSTQGVLPTNITYSHSDMNFIFNSWDNYKDGLFISIITNIYNYTNINDDDSDIIKNTPIITLFSERLPITQEIYKYYISLNNSFPYKINLDNINMNITTLNTVNKIEKKIINVQRPDDYNSNIIKPVYIHSNLSDNIILHNNVNESISINLSQYINLVKVFSILIANIKFVETGRFGSNVIFKITGKLLPEIPNSTAQGTYYIIDENNDLVTTGNYTYSK